MSYALARPITQGYISAERDRAMSFHRLLVLAALAAISLTHLGARCAAAPQPLSPATATADLSFNFKRSVAVGDDGTTHVVWHDDRAGTHQVFYRRTLQGTEFDVETLLSAGAILAEHPSVATAGDWVYVAYHEGSASGQDVFLLSSNDRGLTFGSPVRVSGSGASALASLAATDTRVHIAWMDDGGPSTEVMVRTSLDHGATWNGVEQLSDAPYASWVPTVETSGDQVTVAWVDYRDANEEVYVRHSVDAGQSFGPRQRITNDPADSWAPTLVVDGAFVALAWFDRRDSPVTDAEVELPLDIAMSLLGLPPDPSPPRDPEIYYLPLFEARVARKVAAILAAGPAWVAAGGDLALLQAALDEYQTRMNAWVAGFSVFLRRSGNGGLTFTPAVRLSTPPGPALRPSLALDGNDLHVTWFDGRHQQFDIFYRHSPDRGVSFKPELRLTQGASQSLRPTIAAARGRAELVWRDDRDGLPRIFHQRLHVTSR